MLRPILPTLVAALALCVAAMTQADDTPRSVALEGVQNTRDLGGLITQDGRTVWSGQLIRSGEIDHIATSGKAVLADLGIAAVIDLRTLKEASAGPAEWSVGTGPERHNVPLLEQQSALIDDMRSQIISGAARELWMDQTFLETFRIIPTEYTEEIRQVFDLLLDAAEGEAVLYHCSGGKDRTGVTTALILTALGVPRDQIEADFLLSNAANDADAEAARMAGAINAQNGTSMTAAAIWPSLGVRPAYLDLFYDTLDTQYGGVEGYLHNALGLTGAEIGKLKDRYLD